MSDHEDGDQKGAEYTKEAKENTLQEQVSRLKTENTRLTEELNHLKAMICDDSEFSLNDRLKDEEYRNWIVCTLYMTETKDLVGPFAEEKLKELSDKAKAELKSGHAHTWDDVELSGQRSNQVLGMKCTDCQKILKDIILKQLVNLRNQSKYKKDNCKQEPWLEHYWVLAKIFLHGYPYIARCQSTKDLDATALLDILMQWKMFPRQDGLYQDLKTIRNNLMHSPNNKVDRTTMNDNLYTLMNWLNLDLWRKDDACVKMRDKLNKLRNINDTDEMELDVKMVEEKTLETQKKSVEQDLEAICEKQKQRTEEDVEEQPKLAENEAVLKLRINKTDQLLKENKVEALDEQVKEKDTQIKEAVKKLDESKTENEQIKMEVTELKKEKEKIVEEKSTVEKEKETLQKEKTQLVEKLKDTPQGKLEEEKKTIEEEREKLVQERKNLEEEAKRVEQMKTSPEDPPPEIYSRDRQIWVGNLPLDSSEDYLTNYFEGRKFDPLPTVTAVMMTANDQAVVTFEDKNDVDTVMAMHRKQACVLGGKPLTLASRRDEPEDSEPLVRYVPVKEPVRHLDIMKVDPVINDELQKKFAAKMEAMKNRSPDSEIPERSLWYCADDKGILDSIVVHGFDRANPGLHNFESGGGVYFADNVKQFSDKLLANHEIGEQVFALQAKVLIGNSCKGRESMTQLPDSCDSAVDDTESPTEYMIFDTDQACPLFLLTLKLSFSPIK